MIRYTYINNLVLNIYSSLPSIQFPLDVKAIVEYIPNCKYMSYQQFAEVNGCSVEDVIQLCESKSGCTHYNATRKQYLILCNQSVADNNAGRQLWTCAHEIGHVVCEHHAITAEGRLPQINAPEYEAEADYFAATLLAPFPLFKFLKINSASDVKKTFGLSNEASTYCFEKYNKWQASHFKKPWENDIFHTYIKKSV